MDNNEDRLETLEIKMMDLERVVTDLNDVIIRQYKLIDALQSAQNKIDEQLQNLDTGAAAESNDPPPPHY